LYVSHSFEKSYPVFLFLEGWNQRAFVFFGEVKNGWIRAYALVEKLYFLRICGKVLVGFLHDCREKSFREDQGLSGAGKGRILPDEFERGERRKVLCRLVYRGFSGIKWLRSALEEGDFDRGKKLHICRKMLVC